MTTVNQNFTMWSGDTKSIVVTVDTDITGATVNYVLQKSLSSVSQKITKSTGGNGISLTDPANGELTITLDPADTANHVGDYYQECQVTLGGVVATVLVGTVTIKQDIV